MSKFNMKFPVTCTTGEVVSNYKDYLKTEHWKLMRQRMRKVKNNQCCFICKDTEKLDVHHRYYENLGNEHTKELMFLCRSCHYSVHERLKTSTNKQVQLFNVARIMMRERRKMLHG